MRRRATLPAMPRRFLGLVAAAAILWLGIALFGRHLGDEDRIRGLFAAEASHFNACRALSVLDSFASDYRDDTTGLGRQELRAGLLWLFQNRRDPATRRFAYRLEVDEELPVAVDGDRAQATLRFRLHEGQDPDPRVRWEAEVTAGLERRDGRWSIVGSRHRTLQGRPPP